MASYSVQNISANWLEADLRLVGTLDNRLIALLQAIAISGSINQAAKQVGLSYKGAWQIIEKANNLAPKVLVSSATGGTKGGGTCLTAAGQALLNLFNDLQQQHNAFIAQLNRNLADNPEMVLLLQRQVVKTSAPNQLFATITAIRVGAVNAEIRLTLKGGASLLATLSRGELKKLALTCDSDVLVLLNSADISLMNEVSPYQLAVQNQLLGTVIRIQHDEIEAEVILQLTGCETLAAHVTQDSVQHLALRCGTRLYAVFNSQAVIVGTLPLALK